MPVYFVHGFRWARDGLAGVATYTVLHNLNNVSTNYVQNDHSRRALIEALHKSHPDIMKRLEDPRGESVIQFVEQYDPDDESGSNSSQPYAFVADRVVIMAAGAKGGILDSSTVGQIQTDNTMDKSQVASKSSPAPAAHPPKAVQQPPTPKARPSTDPTSLSVNIEEIVTDGPAVSPQAWEALAELRDALAEGEKIGWWVVYNGDPGRPLGDESSNDSSFGEDNDSAYSIEDEAAGAKTPTQGNPLSNYPLLNQPLPTMLTPSMKEFAIKQGEQPKAIPPPVREEQPRMPPPQPQPPELQKPPLPSPKTERPKTADRPKTSSGRSFSLPLRRKASAGNLPKPADNQVPNLPKLKDITKKQGLRSKFFGRK